MISEQTTPAAKTPVGINHLVLRVRDLEESHIFWTTYLGLKHVGTKTVSSDNGDLHFATRFYSGRSNGQLSHHDVALVQDARPSIIDQSQSGLDHVAIEYATDSEWTQQLDFLISLNVTVSNRVQRGTMLSAFVTDPNGYELELVCELPRESWASDINAALNKKAIPLEKP